jgi:hypothetical protein
MPATPKTDVKAIAANLTMTLSSRFLKTTKSSTPQDEQRHAQRAG